VSTADRAQQQAAGRAGWRLAAALVGALAVLLPAVPLAVLVRARWSPLVEADLAVSRSAQEWTASSDALLRGAKAVTLLGEPLLLTVVAAALAVGLVVRGHRRLALFVVVTRLGAMALSSGLKLAVDRARPVFNEPVATALGASFPSGHALGSAAFYLSGAVLLQPYVRRSRWPFPVAASIAVAVAATRVLLGVHFPSDVAAGLLIGAGWVAVCAAVFAVWRREQGRPVDVVAEGVGR